MNTHANKTKEQKSQQSTANEVSQMQVEGKSSHQFVDNRPAAVAQKKRQEVMKNSPQSKHAAQLQSIVTKHTAQQENPIQKKANNTGLPDTLKTGIESLSGYAMDDVKVHYNSDKPAQLHAHAYAQGTDIHLASGQEKHLPHEAWHVVQQKQGRVKPTMQMKAKVNINDDEGLEKEADVMGAKAMQLKHDESKPLMIQRKALAQSVAQLVLDLKSFTLAEEIAAKIGVSKPKVFNIMLANASVWNFEDDQKEELADAVRAKLQDNQDAQDQYDEEKDFADQVIEEVFHGAANQAALRFIEMVQRSGAAEDVVLYRGTNPKQALAMLVQQTMGGAPERLNDDRDPPDEQMQIRQTGDKVKQHLDSTGQQSTLEEWSRNDYVSRGFATGGWLLVCVVAKVRTNYDESVASGSIGEAGVVSWIETPALVAVLEKGRRL